MAKSKIMVCCAVIILLAGACEKKGRPRGGNKTSGVPDIFSSRTQAPPVTFPMGLSGVRESNLLTDRTGGIDPMYFTLWDYKLGKKLRLSPTGLISVSGWSWCDTTSQWIIYWNHGWCVVSRDGRIHKRLTSKDDGRPESAAGLPIWRPGVPEVLLYEDGNFRMVSIDGKRNRRIATTKDIPQLWHIFFSADGKYLVYRTSHDTYPFGYMLSDGTGHHRVVVPRPILPIFQGPECNWPKWSADGLKVAIVTGIEKWYVLCFVDLVTHHVAPICRRYYDEDGWAISPDTQWIIGLPYGDQSVPKFMELINTKTRQAWKVSNFTITMGRPAFSPDSRWFGFLLEGLYAFNVERPDGFIFTSPMFPNMQPRQLVGWGTDGMRVLSMGGCLSVVTLNGTCTRIWPDNIAVEVKKTDIKRFEIPLEQDEQQEYPITIEAVPSTPRDLPPTIKDLPIQVVEE